MAGVLAYARHLGLEPSAIVCELGLDETLLSDPESRIAHLLNHRVWERVGEASGDVDFGLHMAERMDLDAFHVLGHLAMHSATVGAAFARIVEYSRLLHDAGRVEVEVVGDEVVVFPGCRGLSHAWPRQIAEYSAASVLTLTRAITGMDHRASRVGFKHAKPPSVVEHVRIFGVLPSFSLEETFVTLPTAVLDVPVLAARSGISTFLDCYARELLARLPTDASDVASVVKRNIVEALPRGVPSLADIAKRLATTARTLQRRLGESGASFERLLDGARHELALKYVRDGSMSLTEIAFLLGFADTSSFHRAFRRWTGKTPREIRAAGAQGPSLVAESH